MSEIDKLEKYLRENGYEYTRVDDPCYMYSKFAHGKKYDCGKHKLIVKKGSVWEAECQYDQFGYEDGLMTITGKVNGEHIEWDHFTALDVILRLKGDI